MLAQEQRWYRSLFVQGFFATSACTSSPCWGQSHSPGARPRHSGTAAVELRASSASDTAGKPGTATKVMDESMPEMSPFRPGQESDGEVVHMSDHGAVVKLSGTQTTGFVHVSQMKEGYVHHPSEEVSVGQKVRVRVLKADPNFLGLTMKNLGKKSVGDFMIGQEVQGRVLSVMAFGAWVDIGADKDGLLHKTQMKEDVFIDDARKFFKVGEDITARVRWKDEAKGKIELSMKPASEVLMPLQRGLKVADMKEGEEMGGVITSVRNFGCFVDVGAEADGLIHIRNLNDGLVSNIDSVMKHGDNVVVKVIGVRDGKLELSLVSPLARLQAVDSYKAVPNDEWLDGTIVAKARFGIFVEVSSPGDPEVAGFLGYKQAKGVEGMRLGDKVKVRVLEVDTAKKHVFLTMKSDADGDDGDDGEPAASEMLTAAAKEGKSD